MELFQVTLKKGEDIDAFYDDMETPGGALHIPDRKIECGARRPTSRTTGYMLTLEEAQEVSYDDRVEVVVPQSVLDRQKIKTQATFTGRFDKSAAPTGATTFTRADGTGPAIKYTVTHRPWGMLRHIESNNRSGWGDDAASSSDRYVDTSVTYSASGKNVDIIIVDNHTWYDHEDFTSRAVDYNWGQHYNAITGGSNYTYTFALARATRVAEVDAHPGFSASIAAGTLYGIANDANLYNFSTAGEEALSGGNNTDRTFAYIREFHRTKAVNPATGRKNPTIVNVSLGSYNVLSGASIAHFQGVTLDKGSGNMLTAAELHARGIYSTDDDFTSNTDFSVNSSAPNSDLVDAIDEGIIVVTSGGNENRYTDVSGGDNWDNYLVADAAYANKDYFFNGYYPFRDYYHRGDNFSFNGAINVGALSSHTDQGKSYFSNWGPGIDVYAAGEKVISASANSEIAFGIPYPGQENNQPNWDTIGFSQGTSYSAPFVTGMLACLAEIYPTLTQAQARTYLRENAVTGLMQDTGSSTTDWTPTDLDIDANATTAAWFDASDTSSYTLSGSNVTAVTDKKGNATVTVNGTPNVSNTLDGKNVWTFTAGSSEDFTTDEFAQVDSAGNHWAIGLMQWNTRNDPQDSFWSTENNTVSSGSKRDYAISSSSTNSFDGELDLDGLSSNRISSSIGNTQPFAGGIAQNTWVIVCAIFNKTGNQIAIRVNGTDAFTPVNDYDNALNTNLDLRFFRNRANERMGGRMAEFLTFAGLPGTGGTDVSHVERIEGYLAHKWAQTGSLPSDHAYKSTAPKQDAVLVPTDTKVSLDGSDIDRIALWKNHRQTSGNMAFNTYNKDVNDRPTSGLMYPRVRTRRRG